MGPTYLATPRRMCLESQWLIIMGCFRPITAYFGVQWPIISSYLAVQGVQGNLAELPASEIPLEVMLCDLSPPVSGPTGDDIPNSQSFQKPLIKEHIENT